MSLPTAQQRVLNAMDHLLRTREPGLASMFDMFTRLTAGETRPAWEELTSAPRSRFWRTQFRSGSRSRGLRASARLRRSGLRGGVYRVLVVCPLLTVLAVLGLLVGLNPGLVPASCRTTASVAAAAAHASGSSCQKMPPLVPAK
jgi:hypothetical protein